MKLLLPLLFIINIPVYATEINLQEFISELKKNQSTLEHIKPGMSSQSIRETNWKERICDQNGNCKIENCKIITTINKTILAVFNNDYYIHIDETSTATSNDSNTCNYNSNSKKIELESLEELVSWDLTWVDKFISNGNNEFTLTSNLASPNGTVINSQLRLDLSKSIFHQPIASESTGVDYTSNMLTYNVFDQDPKSFDISNIVLCISLPMGDSTSYYKCFEEDDYTYLIFD